MTDTEIPALADRVSPAADERPEWRAAATEFRQLRYFVTVAEELHFGRAAACLYISQPALSQAIAKLESAIAVQLLVRNRQGVELTEAGRELLCRSRSLLNAREEAVNRVRLIDQGDVGVLRLGVALFAEHAVSPALAALGARQPHIALDRVVAVTDRLVAQLSSGMLDAVLGHAMPSIIGLDSVDSELMVSEQMVALVGPLSPLAGRTTISFADLRHEGLMIPPRELAPSARVGMISMCRAFGGFEPNLFESAAMATAPLGPEWLAQAGGRAVALAGVSLARAGLPGGLLAVPIESPPLLSVALIWRRGDASPVVERLIDFMRELRDAPHATA